MATHTMRDEVDLSALDTFRSHLNRWKLIDTCSEQNCDESYDQPKRTTDDWHKRQKVVDRRLLIPGEHQT